MSRPPAYLLRMPERVAYPIEDSLLIGRSLQAEIPIDSDRASRKHCLLSWLVDSFRLTDLGSANGTRVNNRDIGTGVDLSEDDVVSVGGIDFVFHLGEPVPEQMRRVGEETIVIPDGQTFVDRRSQMIVVLVADIVDFSRISRTLNDNQLTCFLNLWYGRSRLLIRGAGGEINKFLGDGFLAFWEASEIGDGGEIARAALAMASTIELPEDIEKALSDQGLEARCGVGLHYGVAELGPVIRGERTIIGDTVNIAFRIESMTRQLGKPIVASGDYVSALNSGCEDFKSAGLHPLKGYEEFELFTLDET